MIDTSVVVSALINPHGPSARIIDLIILGRITPVFDDRITAEYRAVLARSKFGFEASDIDALMELLAGEDESIVAAPLVVVDLPDADDLPFLEVAVTASCSL
ncbi:MAG: putative toxin-antitoxin system toxin component, PIN family [Thermoleophilia bacterium]